MIVGGGTTSRCKLVDQIIYMTHENRMAQTKNSSNECHEENIFHTDYVFVLLFT